MARCASLTLLALVALANTLLVLSFTQSGLTEACLDEKRAHYHADVRAAVLAYILDRIPTSGVACLAGNTVHADAAFLKKEMPEVSVLRPSSIF